MRRGKSRRTCTRWFPDVATCSPAAPVVSRYDSTPAFHLSTSSELIMRFFGVPISWAELVGICRPSCWMVAGSCRRRSWNILNGFGQIPDSLGRYRPNGWQGATELRSAVVTAYPRIHITLVDLGHGTGRRYGGAGFAVDGLTTTARATKASHTELVAPSHFEAPDISSIRSALDRLSDRVGTGFNVSVRCDAPCHVGLGTKTSCVLAALRACNATVDAQLGTRELVKLAGRGGTSGIGVNTAFVGGFVADAGQPANAGARLLPSSAATGVHELPPAIVKLGVPDQWRIHLFLPDGKRLTGKAEREFFQRHTPIPRTEILEVLASVYHGVAPSFASGNLLELAHALRQIHTLGFKKREVASQGSIVLGLLRDLNDLGNVAAGMSSMGPLVYAIATGGSEELTAHFISCYGSVYVGEFGPQNQGSEVTYLGSTC